MSDERTIQGVLYEDKWYIDAWTLAVEAREQGYPEMSDALHNWLAESRKHEPKKPWPGFRRAR